MCKVGIYLVCDYLNRDGFLKAVEICNRYKIDFLEIGFPFSDPVADGPVIEKAALDVLKRENTSDFFKGLKSTREIFKGRLYVMTYANVVFGYGSEKFAKEAQMIDGMIIADLPLTESGRFKRIFDKYNINLIHFATPESSYEDMDEVKKMSKDFIYFVSTRGITGGGFSLDHETTDKINYTRNNFNKDVILGFGIRSKDDIDKACKAADGVVIGTEAVRAIEENRFENFIKSLR